MSIWERLDAVDRGVFLAINGAYAPWADTLMETLSNMFVWFPLYLALLFVLRRRFGWKGLAWSALLIAAMVVCSDKGSVLLFKETVMRLRPCHEPALQGLVHLGHAGCGGNYGFVSSHASNHFAIALFLIGVLRGRPRWAASALLAWALLIGYSRVYLGVHYPGDVIVGALYGSLIGAIFATLHRLSMARLTTA